jgi:putative DNA primase/helicase
MNADKLGADDFIQAGGRIEDLPRLDPPGPHCTDLGNAERFARLHGPDLRYVFPWRAWLEFDGKIWARDAGDRVRERAKCVARALYREVTAQDDPDRWRHLARWALKTESERSQRNLIELAKSSLAVSPVMLDVNPWRLNVGNGTIDLRPSGDFRHHSRADFITKLAPTDYDPTAQCPAFRKFLAMIFADNTALID